MMKTEKEMDIIYERKKRGKKEKKKSFSCPAKINLGSLDQQFPERKKKHTHIQKKKLQTLKRDGLTKYS
jgi:hypothetical protein